MDGRALGGLEGPAGKGPQRHRVPGRPRRGGAHLREALAGLLGHQPHGRELAHAALAGAHRGGGVALGELDRVVALLHAQVDVLGGHVLAQAGEALALAIARDRRRHRHLGRALPDALQALAPCLGSRDRVLVAEAQRVGGLGSGHAARQLGVLEHARAADLARRVQAVGHVGEREHAALGRRRPSCAPAWSSSEVAGELPPDTTSRSQSISLAAARAGLAHHGLLELAAAERLDHGGAAPHAHAAALERLERRAGAVAAKVGHRHQLHAGVHQRQRRLEAAVADCGHHGARAGLHRPERGQPARAARQHHAGQVVAGEQQRLLDRAGGVHVAAGADLMQGAPLPDRHEAVEGAQRRRVREHLHAGLAGPLGQLARVGVAALGEQPPTGLGALVAQHRVGAQLGGGDRRRQPGGAAAHHQHVGMAAAVLGAPLALGLALAQLPEPGRVAQHLLVERPQPARADERLVVEAGRGEGAGELVGGGHHVELERGARVHVRHLHALAHRLGAGPHAGRVAHLHEAVGALAGAAHQPARAVVLERAREGAAPRGEQRRADRVALVRGHLLAVEAEAQLAAAIDALAVARGQPAHCGSSTSRTSFVRVSRSAWNQAPQPERWHHHSRCTPATLRRK